MVADADAGGYDGQRKEVHTPRGNGRSEAETRHAAVDPQDLPVVDPASGDASDAIPYATSSALTSRPKGCRRRSASAAASRVVGGVQEPGDPRGIGGPGRYGVDPDPLGCVVRGHGEGEREDSALASAVESSLSDTDEGDCGAGVHHRRMR